MIHQFHHPFKILFLASFVSNSAAFEDRLNSLMVAWMLPAHGRAKPQQAGPAGLEAGTRAHHWATILIVIVQFRAKVEYYVYY